MPPIVVTVTNDRWTPVFVPGDAVIQVISATLTNAAKGNAEVCLQARVEGDVSGKREWTIARAAMEAATLRVDLRLTMERLELRLWCREPAAATNATWTVNAMLSPLGIDEDLLG